MNYKHHPKVELHLHLDCSLSFDVVKQLNPAITFSEYQESFIAPPKCTDLADYIRRANKSIELMQTRDQLRLVTMDLFRQLKADHVIYAEIRFAPLLHTKGGLSAEQVVEIVNETALVGMKENDIHAGIILCTLRHFSEEQSLQTVRLVKKYQGTPVVGFDIASDEAGYSIDNHIRAFQFAKENDISCTAHAGEARGAASVWETLEHFNPKRIGHGVRSAEDDDLVIFLKENNIHLEICPTSNIQVDVFHKIANHTVDNLFNAGVSLSINTDTRTISNVTLTKEYQLLQEAFNWEKNHFRLCNLAAIQHAFATDNVKRKIRSEIENAY